MVGCGGGRGSSGKNKENPIPSSKSGDTNVSTIDVIYLKNIAKNHTAHIFYNISKIEYRSTILYVKNLIYIYIYIYIESFTDNNAVNCYKIGFPILINSAKSIYSASDTSNSSLCGEYKQDSPNLNNKSYVIIYDVE